MSTFESCNQQHNYFLNIMSLTNISYRFSNLSWATQHAVYMFQIGEHRLNVSLSMNKHCCERFEISLYKNFTKVAVPPFHMSSNNGVEECELTSTLLDLTQSNEVTTIELLNANNNVVSLINLSMDADVGMSAQNYVNERLDALYNENVEDGLDAYIHSYRVRITLQNNDVYIVEVSNYHNGYYPHEFKIVYGNTIVELRI